MHIPSNTHSDLSPSRHTTIARGAVVNILGSCGKVLIPVYFILITRLFGPATMGVYYMAFVVIDIALTLTVSGFNDGILLYCSRYADDSRDEEKFYRILANGFLLTLGLAALLVAGCHFWGLGLLRARYPQPGFIETLQVMSLAIPFSVLSTVVIAATKSRMNMKWDALLNGFLRPLLLILFALVALTAGNSGLRQLAQGYLATSIVLTFAAVAVYRRYFSLPKLLFAFRHFRLERGLLAFVIPQNLNRTFNTFVTNLDVLMLGYFGLKPEAIGFYGIGAQVVRNIREIKLAFAGSYAPVIVRQHQAGDNVGMGATMTTVSRWIISIALPVAIVIGILRQDILLLFHATFTSTASFMLFLLIPPLLSCSFGLAGNIVVMTGYSLVNLGNSVLVAASTLMFNALLIPRFGLMGAAMATMLASVLITLLQLVEARYLIGVRIDWPRLKAPYLAVLPAALLLAVLPPTAELTQRLVQTTLCIGVYAALLARLSPDKAYRQALVNIFTRSPRERAQ
nr:oligosaccharide flippase family protein [uncultured Desulfobulbus sp.]